MTHAEMDGFYELYALGVLESEAANEIDAHLRDECAYCLEHVREALQVTTGLAALADAVMPPAHLRARVLGGLKSPTRSRNWLFAVVALSAACVALVVFSLWSTGQMRRMRQQLSDVLGERDELRSAIQILTTSDTRAVESIREQLTSVRDERNRLRSLIAVLTRPDTRVVEFGRGRNVPHGRIFVNGAGGLVFVGSQLPALAGDRTFELWLVPHKGAPQPAGLFRPNASGESVHVSQVPADGSKAIAVSIEPRRGSTAPTTKPILVVPLG